MSFSFFGFEVTAAVLALGVIFGILYGLLAVGLMLTYRASRVINFAHGEMGALGAAVLGAAVIQWHIPYWVGFALALSVSASVGAITELAVVRRLKAAPKLMSLVATIGMAQVLVLLSSLVSTRVAFTSFFPHPPGLPEFRVGVLRVTSAHAAMMFLAPVVVASLAVFLKKSRYGVAIRAVAANEERARMSGIFASRTSTFAWAIAGGVSAFVAVFILPARGIGSQFLGPSLLVRALAAAVIARMQSFPKALVAGIGIGIIEGSILFNYPSGAFIEVPLLVLIVGALLLQARSGAREQDRAEDWAAVQPWPVLPEGFHKVFWIRHLGRAVVALVLAAVVVAAVAANNVTAIPLAVILALSLVGLSLGIITGLSGQLSLGQFALAGVGATASYAVAARTGNYFIALTAACVAAAAVSLVIGLPALRIRGLMLAVTTLAFAMAGQWLFQQPWALGSGVVPGRPAFGPVALDTSKKYLGFALLVFGLGLWLARNVWRSGIGLLLRAVRDNEDGARAFGVSAATVKVQAFVLAGLLAGLGGAVYGHLLSRLTPEVFAVGASLRMVAVPVLGGIGILLGPVIGALYIIGVPAFVPLDAAGLAASAFGWLVLILYFPGGLAQLISPVRQRLIDWLARQAGADPLSLRSEAATEPSFSSEQIKLGQTGNPPAPATGNLLLEAKELSKYFGGVRAVDGVTLSVRSGEILGLMGPNGAGKTTTFEIVSGFTSPDLGQVTFAGKNITHLPPEQRAGLGLIRSSQDASLFPTLTVLETVRLSFEKSERTRLISSIVGLHGSDRLKEERARELVGFMGLYDYRTRQIRELSTGTRRITELTCMLALRPTLLLLDEPSAGIAQRESEALAELLIRVKQFLQATLIVIEHDIPLLMKISDRVLAMDAGRIIAEGTPVDVRKDAKVIESYLGGDLSAIQRSGVRLATRADEQCQAFTRSGDRCHRKATKARFCAQHQSVRTADR